MFFNNILTQEYWCFRTGNSIPTATNVSTNVYYHYEDVSVAFWALIVGEYYSLWMIVVSVWDEDFVIFGTSFKGDNMSFSTAPFTPIIVLYHIITMVYVFGLQFNLYCTYGGSGGRDGSVGDSRLVLGWITHFLGECGDYCSDIRQLWSLHVREAVGMGEADLTAPLPTLLWIYMAAADCTAMDNSSDKMYGW